jgi:hypothetical protein
MFRATLSSGFHIAVVSLLLPASQSFAFQTGTRRIAPPRATAGGNRVALVIGNASYPENRLVNPVNDAHDIAAKLRALSFSVVEVENAGLQKIDQAVTQFAASLKPGDVALVYYSGHGIQIDGENYFVPVDFKASNEVEARYAAYSAQKLEDLIGAKQVSLNILILDACRNNPYRGSRGGPGGWATMQSGKGTFIAFATAPGDVASDNPSGKNGLFTKNLLKALDNPGRGIVEVFQETTEGVNADSHGKQQPWIAMSLTGNFVFLDGPRGHDSVTPAPPSPEPAPAPSPSKPDEIPVAVADLTAQRERLVDLKGRADGVSTSWRNNLRGVPSPRQEIVGALSGLTQDMRAAETALQNANADEASHYMDQAEKQMRMLDQFK